jgi:hypothetical protein
MMKYHPLLVLSVVSVELWNDTVWQSGVLGKGSGKSVMSMGSEKSRKWAVSFTFGILGKGSRKLVESRYWIRKLMEKARNLQRKALSNETWLCKGRKWRFSGTKSVI